MFPMIAAPNAIDTIVNDAAIVRLRAASSGIELEEPWLVLPSGSSLCCGPPRPFEVSRTAASVVGPASFEYTVVGNVWVIAELNDSSSAVVDINTSAAPGAGTVIGHPGTKIGIRLATRHLE